MNDADLIARFALLEVVLCVVPGPAVLLTVSTALRRGSRTGLAAACGVVAGNTLYFVLSGAGVAALLSASYAAFTILKHAGAAYLFYLGLRSFFAKEPALADSDPLNRAAPADIRRAFAAGFVTQVSNPKAIVFFVAIVPQFVVPHDPVPAQIAVLTVVSQAIEFFVLASYVAIAARVRRLPAAGRASLWFERAGGCALVLIAAGIAREPIGAR